jgi:tRNA 2-thiouridine synthesizing protein B
MLYLIDEPLADLGFRAARDDPDARLVLLQDGVLLEPELEVPTYAVDRDAAIRGIDLPPDIEPVSYDDLIELVFEHEVASFV